MLHERGRRNHRAPSPLAGWVICQISRYEEICRGRECNSQKRLVIRVGQIQFRLIARINSQTVHFKFGQHFAHSPGIKLETWTGEDFGIFGEDALINGKLAPRQPRPA